MNNATRYTSLAATLIVVATALSAVRLINATPLLSANDRSRWCTVWSLVERDTYIIDEINARQGWSTIDRVRFDDHYYSSKPPLLPRVVAYVTAAVKSATGLSLETKPRTTTRVVLLIVNLLPTVVSWVVLAWMLPKIERSTWGCLFVLVVSCLATLNAPFLVTLNNHSIAIWSLTLTLGCMVWFTTTNSGGGWIAAALGGLFAAWTCCNELPAAPFGLLAFFWFWRFGGKKAWLAFLPMALIPLAAFFYTNYQVTGDWKPFYMSYGTDTYNHVVDGIPSYWMRPQGLDTNPDSTPVYFLHCTIGHHGMLSLTPVFLFTVFVWLGFAGRTDGRVRGESSETAENAKEVARSNAFRTPSRAYAFVSHAGLLLTVLTTAFFLSKTENYNYGGTSCALRWTLWLTPLWTVGMLPAVARVGISRIGRIFANVLLAASLVSAWYPASNPWQHPWIYEVMVRAGTIEEPKPELAPVVVNDSFLQSMPKVESAAVVFEVDGVDAREIRIELAELTEERAKIAWAETERSFITSVDRDAFEARKPVENWLLTTSIDSGDAKELLRLLPGPRGYQPGKRAYIKVPAFTKYRSTWRLASRVQDPTTGFWHRTDLWVATDDELNGDRADDVPFGVLQVLRTVTDRSGGVVSRETWRLKSIELPSDQTTPAEPNPDSA